MTKAEYKKQWRDTQRDKIKELIEKKVFEKIEYEIENIEFEICDELPSETHLKIAEIFKRKTQKKIKMILELLKET